MKLFASVGGYFALDIGTTAVRAVQLSGSEGNWRLSGYGTIPIDHTTHSDGLDENANIRAAVLAVIGQSGIRTKNVILGLPSSKVFSAVVDIPDASTKQLTEAITQQTMQHDQSAGDVSVDWAVLGRSATDPTKNEALVASAAKSFITSQVDLMKELGFTVAAIEPNALALTRALMPAQLADGCLVMEVGNFTTDIVVAYDNAPRSLCSLPVGMQTFVGAVSRSLKVESVQATQFIMKFGMQTDKLEGHVRSAMEPLAYKIVAEIVRSISLFQTKYPGVNLSKIIISGYGATIPHFCDYITLKVGVPAEQGDPWQGIDTSGEDPTQLQSLSSQFAVAIGLAERGVGA